jgi:hypothetical protein
MLNQYGSQRHRVINGRPVGTIPVGTIVYIQDARPFRFPSFPVRREPWIVEAWRPRLVTGYGGKLRADRYVARGGHIAIVRSLRSGRRIEVADWLILAAIDNGCERDGIDLSRYERKNLERIGRQSRFMSKVWDNLVEDAIKDGMWACLGFSDDEVREIASYC